MTALPPLLRKPRKRDNRVRSPGHLAWIRKHACCVGDKNEWTECAGPIEAAHVRNGTDGGTGLKPGDNWTISLCQHHHRAQHYHGEKKFAAFYHLDLNAIAAELWKRSPAKPRWEAKQRKQQGEGWR